MPNKLINIIVFCVILGGVAAQYLGENCFGNGRSGVCTQLGRCPSAIEDRKRGIDPPKCSGFDGIDPIVCCNVPSSNGYGATTSRPAQPLSAQSNDDDEDDIIYKSNTGDDGDCKPIPSSRTAPKTGQKAWDKCIDYQQLVYPCEEAATIFGGKSRANHCKHNADELIVGGSDAGRGEFPHMVLLGFGEETSVIWGCGGTLISDRYILTAGHCTYKSRTGPVKYAKIGILRSSESGTIYNIQTIIKHDLYNPPQKYHDIALLQTDKVIRLDQSVIPACLDVGNAGSDDKASATGWGNTRYLGNPSNTLQKVILEKFSNTECHTKNPPGQRYLRQGYDENTQVCFGDHKNINDTCQGDSGGPLQTKHTKIHCMYNVIGVTSYGKQCGTPDQPGMFTRVSYYVPWIESIVWP